MKRTALLFLSLMLIAWATPARAERFSGAEAGDIVSFGSYEQGSGRAPIQWIVLDRQEDRALLLSQYALDCQPFHSVEDWNVTWESCSLRGWLNADFLADAFDEEECARILPVFHGDAEDSVFLLSGDELNLYFPTEESRIAEATEYAVSRGGRVSRSTGKTYWWLRTTAASADCILLVKYDGAVDAFGDSMEAAMYTVRPALWVRLSE